MIRNLIIHFNNISSHIINNHQVNNHLLQNIIKKTSSKYNKQRNKIILQQNMYRNKKTFQEPKKIIRNKNQNRMKIRIILIKKLKMKMILKLNKR
jgi:hypothetical protein